MTTVSAPANIRDRTLLAASLEARTDWQPLPAGATVHLDAGYDHRSCRLKLADRGLPTQIPRPGLPTPTQVDRRWIVERTHFWLNDFGEIRRCTERGRACVNADLALAAAAITIRALLRAAWYRYRWNTRPHSPRIH